MPQILGKENKSGFTAMHLNTAMKPYEKSAGRPII